MIGTVKIPLGELVKGASVHERFPIRNNQRENVGLLEAKISIIDIDMGDCSAIPLVSIAPLQQVMGIGIDLSHRPKAGSFPG